MYAEDVLKKHEERAKLIEPTRTDIKEAFIARFSEKTKTRDIEVLRIFFKARREDDLSKKIENSNPEEFRTIQNFLTKKTGTTRKKNLDVIAWLIDFNPRPYNLYRKPSNSGDSGIDIEFDDDPGTEIAIIEPEPIPEKEKEKERKDELELEVEVEVQQGTKPKKWIWITVSSIVLFIGLFYGVNYSSDSGKTNNETKPSEEKNATDVDKKCMAWAETVYKLVNCTESTHPNFKTEVIEYEEILFKNLKRVEVSIKTNFFAPDNKTPLIWYYKVGRNKFEYFTSVGMHPIYSEPLNKITQYHIDTYIPEYTNDKKSYLKE
jgi:hypothetical protein